MIKNPHILKSFERKERLDSKLRETNKWYEKADELYRVAVNINPDIIHSNGEKHIDMLITVREKLNMILKNQ